MNRLLLFSLLVLLMWSGCFSFDNTFTKVPPGPYRAVLKLEYNPVVPNPKGAPIPEKLNLEFEEVTAGELPFQMEIAYDSDTTFYIDIINGSERIRVPSDQILFGRSPELARDTFRIDFPVYDSYISGYYEEDILEGVFVVNYRDQYRIPFVAQHGQNHRFTQLRKEPIMDASGEWAVEFGQVGTDDFYRGIAEFQQSGNELLGTFRTETGDYRYLAGTVQVDKLYLSTFDGSHAFLFEAKILPDSTIVGSYRSGQHFRTTWRATRNPGADLRDPSTLTKPLDPGQPLAFTFPNSDGVPVSLSDPAFRGKAKLVQIMGTWCPNCRDETQFLIDYLQQSTTEDLAVIALAFERYRDSSRAIQSIRRYEQQINPPYPVLYAGYYGKEEAKAALPMLDAIRSYPTLLFIDRNDQIQYIHTGFNGPATSTYADFVTDFEQKVGRLLAEEPTMQ